MQRYFLILFSFVVSVVFLTAPLVDLTAAQAAPAPSLQTKSPQAEKNSPNKQPKKAVTTTAQAKSIGKDKKKSSPVPSTASPQQNRPASPHAHQQHAATTHPTKAHKKAPARIVKAKANTSAAGSMDIAQQISAKSTIILDAQSGEEIFAKCPDNPRQPASTIKIVTALLALKSLKNDELVDASRHAANMEPSKIGIIPGKMYRVNDLINAVLLASANDASVALGEKMAGSEEKFAQLMTANARLWGAQNTICRTASGLPALGQQSTARDLATMFRYAMQHGDFARRVHEKFITTSYGKVLRNHNRALWQLDGAVGGKTGYTVAARQTYVGQFSRNGKTIVVAIMGSESMWADLAKLVDYGFKKKAGQL
jgi:D-alanyl-D-alanine carboxypeptidase